MDPILAFAPESCKGEAGRIRFRLFLATLRPPRKTVQPNTEPLLESIRTTGAVVMSRRAYAIGDPDWFVDHYEFQVPIFVLVHAVPGRLPRQSERMTFTFVTDGIASAILQAKAAAGD